MSQEWSKLRPLSKLDQLAETIMKTAFIFSENHHVIQSYLNHDGANFKVLNRVGESTFDVLCKQINIEKTNYAFIPQKHLEQGLRDDLYIGLVLFVDNQKPTKFLFPSTVWNQPNLLFTNSSTKRSEYGISLGQKTFEMLKEYAFEEVIQKV